MTAYDAITAFNKSSDGTKKFVAAIGLAAAAIGPAIILLTKFVAVAGSLSKITSATIIGLRTMSAGFSGTAASATAAAVAVRAFRAALQVSASALS